MENSGEVSTAEEKQKEVNNDENSEEIRNEIKSEEPPTFVAKKLEGSLPHPNVKLLRKYMKSQLKITI